MLPPNALFIDDETQMEDQTKIIDFIPIIKCFAKCVTEVDKTRKRSLFRMWDCYTHLKSVKKSFLLKFPFGMPLVNLVF